VKAGDWAQAASPAVTATAVSKRNNLLMFFSFPNTGGAAVSGGTLEQVRQGIIYQSAAARLPMDFSAGQRVRE
jgi:hypothetical protein